MDPTTAVTQLPEGLSCTWRKELATTGPDLMAVTVLLAGTRPVASAIRLVQPRAAGPPSQPEISEK